VSEQLALLPEYLTAHLQLSLLALALGVGVSVPLGIQVTRRPGLEPAALGTASIIQTIPSLALLAIMVPVLAAVGAVTGRVGIDVRGIGFVPALVALTLYGILPILRNTVTGIDGIPPALREAARAVGMTDAQRLRRVELPLALPVIVAGVRTSAVWIVGTATLSTPVGATSLGNFIFSGLQTRNDAAVLVGCVAAAGLAIVLDQAIRLLEHGLRRRRRAPVAISLSLLAALACHAAGSFAFERLARPARAITIGAKPFTEQYILAEILAQRVREDAAPPAQVLPSLGTKIAFDAIVAGDLDLYVEYSGTVWATIMKRTDRVPRAQLLQEVVAFLEQEQGLRVVGALGFENTYAIAMRADHARELGVTSLSGLAPHAARLEIGSDYVFFQREEWRALVDVYGLSFARERSMDSALMYEAIATGEVDVISAYSTDGRVEAFDLTLLDDDRAVIPPYDALLLAGSGLAREHPEVIERLRGLAGRIDAAEMRRMNLAVDREGETASAVAQRFLARLPE
jgi:osmoprotectant transport system permease protein